MPTKFSIVFKRELSNRLTELREVFFEVNVEQGKQFYVPDLVDLLLKLPKYKDYEYEETRLC